MKRLILLVSLMILIGIVGVVLVSAFYSESQNQITIPIKEGWNLISSSLIQSSKYLEFKYVYIYDPKNQDYVLLVYNGKEFDEIENVNKNLKLQKDKTINFLNRIQSEGDETFLVSSVWAYSEKEGEMEFEWDDFQKNKLSLSGDNSLWKLNRGWNFIWVTPEMSEKSLSQLKGNCDIQGFYMFVGEGNNNGWTENLADFLANRPLDDDWVGQGFIIKVSDNCKLGTSEANVPSVPNLP